MIWYFIYIYLCRVVGRITYIVIEADALGNIFESILLGQNLCENLKIIDYGVKIYIYIFYLLFLYY